METILHDIFRFWQPEKPRPGLCIFVVIVLGLRGALCSGAPVTDGPLAGTYTLAPAAIGSGGAASSAVLPQIIFDGRTVGINKVLLLGPFEGSRENGGWEFDFLSKLGQAEDRLGPTNAMALARSLPMARGVKTSRRPRCVLISQRSECVDTNFAFKRPYGGTPPTAVYACCTIRSDRQCQAYLMVGNGGGLVVRLNGARIYSYLEMRDLVTYSDAVPVHFRAGSNFLLVKCGRNRDGMAGFALRIEPDRDSAALAALSGQATDDAFLLKSDRITNEIPAEILVRGGPRGLLYKAAIVGEDGIAIAKRAIRDGEPWDLAASVPPGVYRFQIRLPHRRDVFEQPVCVGSLSRILATLKERLRRQETDPQSKADFGSLFSLLSSMCGSPLASERNESDKVENWSRQLVYRLNELQSAVGNLEHGRSPFSGPGIHLLSFRSRIDDQWEHYQLSIPRGQPGEGGWPLVVMVTPAVKSGRPFLFGPLILGQTAFSDASLVARLGENHGFAVLWPGYRNIPEGFPCEFTHFDEVLDAANGTIKVDPTRIYLTGSCGSGREGGLVALRWPHRFAAAAFLHPTFGNAADLPPVGQRRSALRDAILNWRDGLDVLGNLEALRTLPFCILYDGSSPGHGTASDSAQFCRQARAVGCSVRYEERPQSTSGEIGGFAALFDWLATQRRADPSQAPDIRYFRRLGHPGPISAAVADRFVVVLGSEGSEDDRMSMGLMAGQFQQAWRAVHFGPCRVISDKDLTDEEEQRSNLILVGNGRCNAAWRRFAVRCGIRIFNDRVAVGSSQWAGRNLDLEAVMENPNHPDKSLVFIGSFNPRRLSTRLWDLTGEGWFDYAVWSDTGGSRSLVDAGLWRTKDPHD